MRNENNGRNKELEALLEVSKVLTASFDLEENLNAAMKALGRMLDMQRGCVFLLEPPTGEIKIVAAYGLTGNEIKRGKYKIGEGIVGGVMEAGRPSFVPNIGKEPRFLNKTASRPRKDGVSFISVPIGIKGETFGVLSADRIYAEEHGGVDDDLRVLEIVASLIAQFVKLYETYRKAEDEKESLRSQLRERFRADNIVGESEKFRAVLKAALKAAGTDATVLLLGESGTGKELIAKTVHYQSGRAGGPFVAVNCAALPDNLLEAELFGSEKGAFTGATSKRIGRFETARGGSLFLDEVGELPLALQAKLLRVLQERTFERIGSSMPIKADLRVIAATNKNLIEEVKRGGFREDLYWRLNVLPIVLPPLRERKGDISLLIKFYTDKFNVAYGKNVAISDEALKSFIAHDWPGNVRELANVLESLIIMSEKNLIEAADLAFGAARSPLCDVESSSLKEEVFELERRRIILALKENGFIQHRAANALGITPRQLGYRVRKYRIALQ